MLQTKCHGKWLSVRDMIMNGITATYALAPFDETPEQNQPHIRPDDDVILPMVHTMIADSLLGV